VPIRIDSMSVEDEHEATLLMVHHLQLAARYFEATRNDRGLYANSVIRNVFSGHEGGINAASSFIEVLESSYDEEDE